MKTISIERPTFTFEVPEGARVFETDPKSISMRPITAAEEQRANEAADGGKNPLAYELVRLAVTHVDGAPVDWNSPTGPEWVERCGPKVRQLVLEAFASINRPADEDTKAFLASRKTSLGG